MYTLPKIDVPHDGEGRLSLDLVVEEAGRRLGPYTSSHEPSGRRPILNRSSWGIHSARIHEQEFMRLRGLVRFLQTANEQFSAQLQENSQSNFGATPKLFSKLMEIVDCLSPWPVPLRGFGNVPLEGGMSRTVVGDREGMARCDEEVQRRQHLRALRQAGDIEGHAGAYPGLFVSPHVRAALQQAQAGLWTMQYFRVMPRDFQHAVITVLVGQRQVQAVDSLLSRLDQGPLGRVVQWLAVAWLA